MIAVARRRDRHERRELVIRLVAFTVAVFVPVSCAPVGSTPAVIQVDGVVFYFERLALPPSAVVDVELRDAARADAPARTLATQRIPATQGPPFKFALSVPATDIAPHAALSVFATCSLSSSYSCSFRWSFAKCVPARPTRQARVTHSTVGEP
jgi:uncharacterized lipoprotein YbaY